MANERPYYARQEAEVKAMSASAVDIISQSTLKAYNQSITISKSSSKEAASSVDTLASKTSRSVKQMCTSVQGDVKKTSRAIDADLGDIFKRIDASRSRITVLKNHIADIQVNRIQQAATAAGGFKDAFDAGAANNVGGVVSAVRALSLAFTPLVAAIATGVAALGLLIGNTANFQKKTMDLQKSLGGTRGEIDDFASGLWRARTATRLSEDQLLSLTDAFNDAGVPMLGLTTKMNDQLIVGGKAVRMFNLTDEAAAEFTNTLYANGASLAEAETRLSNLYVRMQDVNGTVRDANLAIMEGTYQWQQYGGIQGKTVDKFADDILKTKGMFKAFNMDAKGAAESVNSLFGDREGKMRRAQFISSMLGIPGSDAYNKSFDDPQAALMDDLGASFKLAIRELGPNAGSLAMSSDQMKGAYSGNQLMRLRDQQTDVIPSQISHFINADAAKRFNGELADFRGYVAGKGGYKGGNVEQMLGEWIESRKAEHGSNPNPKTLAQGMEGLNGTFPEQLNNLMGNVGDVGRSMVSGFDKVTGIAGEIAKKIGVGQSAIDNITSKPAQWTARAYNTGNDIGAAAPGFIKNMLKGGVAGGAPMMSGGGGATITAGGATGKKQWGGAGKDPKFRAGVIDMAKRLKLNPDWLMGVMQFESGIDPHKKNYAGSGATGLIQFMPDTARGLGTSTGALGQMSATQQLPFVEKYFKNKAPHIKNMRDMYMSVLYPAAMGKGAEHTLFSADSKSRLGKISYKQNAGLDTNKDGRVTAGEAAAHPMRKLMEFQSITGNGVPGKNGKMASAGGVGSTDVLATLMTEQNKLLQTIADNSAAELEEKKSANKNYARQQMAHDPYGQQQSEYARRAVV